MQSQQNPTFRTKQAHHFARLFPELDPLFVSDLQLKKLALTMQDWDHQQSQTISNGLAIFSQFLAHDMTFEVTSSLLPGKTADQFVNERTINLDLDCLYGQPNQSFYYDQKDRDKAKLLLGKHYKFHGRQWYDLLRNQQHIAIIPDARNDENIIVSRFQALMIRFHNKVVDYLRECGEKENIFEKARRLTTWHYQWLIVQKYLRGMMDPTIFRSILEEGCQYYTQPTALPLEFSGAAFRVGHSQSLDQLHINATTEVELLKLGAFEQMEEYVDWRYLFDFGDGKVQFAKALDTKIANSFHRIPFISSDDPFEKSLPFRNLKRGVSYQLPSGEQLAQRLQYEPVWVEETAQLNLQGTPLWYYILREAEILGEGEHLGPVGSTLLGECFFTILRHDDRSYMKIHPRWHPQFGRAGKFDFSDLIQFVEAKKAIAH